MDRMASKVVVEVVVAHLVLMAKALRMFPFGAVRIRSSASSTVPERHINNPMVTQPTEGRIKTALRL
jgi:hypothetical protein